MPIGDVGNGRRQVGRKLPPRVRNLQADGRQQPRRPSTAAPSSAITSAATPANVILFAGYGFAKEYRQARGHVHSVEDVTQTTTRVNAKKPATCWTCKSPDVPRLMHEMGGPVEVLCRQVRRSQGPR